MTDAAHIVVTGRRHDGLPITGGDAVASRPLPNRVGELANSESHFCGAAKALDEVGERFHDAGRYISSYFRSTPNVTPVALQVVSMTSTPAARLRALSKAAGFARLAEFARAAKVPDTNMRQHISRDSIPKDAAALYVGAARRAGVVTATAEWLLFGQGVAPRGTDLLPVEKNPPAIRKEAVSAIANSPIALVVYRTRAGLIGAGAVLVFRDKAGLVTRPAELEASSEAFALVVQGDDWEPRYRRRDTLLVDPSSLNPPAPEDDCLFVKDPEANPFTAIARRLVRITAEHWVVKRFEKDAPEELFPIAEFPAAWRIFGAYNRR